MQNPASNLAIGNHDDHWMRHAVRLAAGGQGFVEPNPMVGCVLVRGGRLIAEGFHAKFGGPHAEIIALQSCDDAKGCTAYVTLEPCCHHGKTPPCTGAMISAGVARVVIGSVDPFPKVDGGGIAQLREAGIEVVTGVCEIESREILSPYLKRIHTGLPWVIAKWAMSIDGKIATRSGDSQWITGEQARADVHSVRGRVDVILTGTGTVVADDPMLTARPAGPRIARRIIACRERMPAVDCQLIRTADDIPTVVCVPATLAKAAERRFAGTGAVVKAFENTAAGGLSLQSLLTWLAEQDSTNVVLESGSTLMGSFFDQKLIDEFHVYIGSKAIGGNDAPGPMGGAGIERLADAHKLFPREVMTLGDDIRITYCR